MIIRVITEEDIRLTSLGGLSRFLKSTASLNMMSSLGGGGAALSIVLERTDMDLLFVSKDFFLKAACKFGFKLGLR